MKSRFIVYLLQLSKLERHKEQVRL